MKSGAASDMQRRIFRNHTKRLLRTRHDPALHLARIEAALEVAGAEPVQGALADLFCTFGPAHAVTKQTILDKSMARLPAHVGNWFASQVHAPALPRVSPLATRWSVLAVVSADISTRARRCSADDSRLLAAQVVDAVGRSDLQAQQLFLHHCLTCHDNLAFMLARRQLLKRDGALPPAWEATSVQLEMTQA